MLEAHGQGFVFEEAEEAHIQKIRSRLTHAAEVYAYRKKPASQKTTRSSASHCPFIFTTRYPSGTSNSFGSGSL